MINSKVSDLVNDELIQKKLDKMAASCERFSEFLRTYEGKIRSKFNKSLTRDNCLDVYTELEAAYMLLTTMSNQIITIEYEKYKNGPDFTITFKNQICVNLEVKRIREWDIVLKYENLRERISERIRAQNIGVNINLTLKWGASGRIDEQLKEKKLLEKLITLCSDIEIEKILQFILFQKKALGNSDESLIQDFPGAENIMSIGIWIPKNPDDFKNVVSWGKSSWGPALKSTKKIRNDILEKQKKLSDNDLNILVLSTRSMYFTERGFSNVLDMFANDQELQQKLNKTCGIIYGGIYSDWCFWENKNSQIKLPKELRVIFSCMKG